MKRYLLFSQTPGIAEGGWDDFVYSYDNAEEAEEQGKKEYGKVFQVVDTHLLKLIVEGSRIRTGFNGEWEIIRMSDIYKEEELN